MGIMNLLQKLKNRNEAYEELKIQDRAHERVEQNKLSSDERALEKYLKREHDDAVRKRLNAFHKKQEKEYWKKDVISQKNLFNGKTNLLNQKNLFKNSKSTILNQPNIFRRQ